MDNKAVLAKDTIEEMSRSLGIFIEEAVSKFIAGQKEHGGRLVDRALDKEMSKEIIDLFWYNSAKDWKM